MASPKTQNTANLYRGCPQPNPDERLAQTRIFLADEDYHRTLMFTKRIAEIEDYIKFIENNNSDYDAKLLKTIKEMIGVHKTWIKRATQAPSTSYRFAQCAHRNRLLSLVKDSKRRVQIAQVKAPKSFRKLNPGPALHKAIEKDDRPDSPDPFLYTKQVTEIRRRQDVEAEQIRVTEESAVLHRQIPVNFNGPYTPLYRLTDEDIDERRSILSQTLKRLTQAAKLAPRPFIHHLISAITDSARNENLEQAESTLTNEDLKLLLTAAEPSWNSEARLIIRNLSEDGTPQSVVFAELLALFNSDFWPDQDGEATIEEVFDRVELDAASEPITINDLEVFLIEMNAVGSIRYDANSRIVRKPLLDAHPENSIPPESYMMAARKFGVAVARLDKLLASDEENRNIFLLKDTSVIPSIKQRVETKYPLPGFNPPMKQSQEPVNETTALLQEQIVLEHYHNWDDRDPNFQSLWAFASNRDTPGQFFSLDRWPPELQSLERQNEILQSGPAPPSPEPEEEQLPRPKKNEIFYPGETLFPFGETPYHEARLAAEIERVRPDAPATRPPYTDPFALPALPESETPALMAYAAKLGLGKRKRYLDEDGGDEEDDDNNNDYNSDPLHAAKTVLLQHQHMASASPDPPPEFIPETIGGVEIRVAQSMAGRTGRRVRFANAPTGAGVSVAGSNDLRRGVAGPVARSGWFSPRLRSKEGGNGGGDGGSVGSGHGAGTSGGRRDWVWRPRAASSSASKSSEQ